MLNSKLAGSIRAALLVGLVAAGPVAASDSSNANGSSTDLAVTPSSIQSTQDTSQESSQSSDADKSTKTKRLDTVQVSGSLINSAQIQTATPTYTITAQDIKKRGFNSVAEVLQNSVSATGTVQGPQSSGGFTQGAQAVSLYGLKPEYALTLIDGKPISQFGQLYNGNSNFTNISNIPISMIDHIDVVPGGGSSIYGSAAIAGVINIVTKDHMDGAEISARAGNYSRGGGQNQRITASFGHQFGKLSVLGSFEFDNQSPIWAYQRSLTKSTNSNPNGLASPTLVKSIFDYGDTGQTDRVQAYVSDPANCSNVSSLFHNSTVSARSTVASRTGTYCGSKQVLGYTTEQNQQRSYNGMLKLKYDVNDHVRLYADALVDFQKQKFTSGSNYNWWAPADFPNGYIEDPSGHILYPELIFSPEEVGDNYYSQMARQDDLMYQADIGANGTFGDSDWDWNIYFVRSGDHTTTSTPVRMKDAVDNFMKSRFLEYVGHDNDRDLDKYNINYAGFFSPLTPADVSSFMRNVPGSSKTWVNNTRAQVDNSKLFSLPGGDAGFAFLVEGGSEAWNQPVNPLIATNQVWGQTGTSGSGTRSHYDSAFELNLPFFKQLTVDLSGRYDHYKVTGGTNHKFTYKAGLEFRPFDTWLLRGNYATSFLAPDMASLFLGPSGNYQYVTDYYQCAKDGSPNCDDYSTQVKGTVYANTKLKPTTAKSWTVGTVWSPIDNLSLSVDYLHISIKNEVDLQSATQLLQEESQCRLGALDASSSVCRAALAQVTRSSLTGNVTKVSQYYVNVSNERTESITAEATYQFPTTPIGRFGVKLDYNDMLKHSYQEYAGQPKIDDLTNPLYSSEFKSIVSGAVDWTSLSNQWSSTLYFHRYGRSPNYEALAYGSTNPDAGYVKSWLTFNWSVTYSPTKDVDVSLLVDNAFDKMPPHDKTFTSWPYYHTANYNIYGREIMLQVDWRFGGSKNN